MPEESTNTDSRATTRTPPANQEVDVSSVQDWEPGLKAYGAGFLDPETLVKLLAATEIPVFELLLELAADKDALDEKQDIGRVLDLILTLKARKKD